MMPCTIYLMREALEELAFSCNYRMKKAEYRQRQRGPCVPRPPKPGPVSGRIHIL